MPLYSYACNTCEGEIELLVSYEERDSARDHTMEDCPGDLIRVTTAPNFIGSRSASYIDGIIPADRKKDFDEVKKIDKLTIQKADLMSGTDERRAIDAELTAREKKTKQQILKSQGK